MAFPFEPSVKSAGLWDIMRRGEYTPCLKRLISPINLALSTWNRLVRPTRRSKFLFEGLEPRLLLSGDPLVYAAAAGTLLDATVRLDPGDSSIIQIVNSADSAVLAQAALADTSEVTVSGSTQNDTFKIDNSLSASDMLLTFNGGGGDDSLTLSSNSMFVVFDAGDGNDTLIGSVQDNDWNVTADNTGTVATNLLPLEVPTISFFGVENISSTSAGDTLSADWSNLFSDLGSISGVLSEDTPDADGSDAWKITADKSVTLGKISFTGIENLTGSGTETLDYSTFAGPVTVNLDTASFTGGFTAVSGFANVTGSAFADNITGDNSDNILSGGGGNDTIAGGDGNDTIIGGDGNDILLGGNGDDEIFGNDGDDTINAGAGNNQVFGGAGNDAVTIGALSRFTAFDGGGGSDTLTGNSTAANWRVTAVNEGTASMGSGASVSTVSFLGVEDIRAGASGSDSLSADGTNVWEVIAANKVSLFNTTFSNIEGLVGNGNDTLDYSAFAGPVTVNLATNAATGFTAGNVMRFRDVKGSSFADNITGNTGDNILFGGDGDDIISGGDGDDVIRGEGGADTLNGQGGDDFIAGGTGVNTLDGGAGNDTLSEIEDLNFTLTDTTLTMGSDSSSLSNFEVISLKGGKSNNMLDASLYTLSGVTLDGAEGDDSLIGTANDDVLTGGLGADTLMGGGGNDTVLELNDSRFTLTNTQLDMGEGTNEVQTITLSNATSGTFTLELDGETTLPLRYNASAEELAQALRGLAGIGEGDIRVTQDITREVQRVTLANATTGTFTLTLDGKTTSALAYNASDEDVALALLNLTGVGEGDIRVADNSSEVQTITLSGATTGDFTLKLNGETTTAISYSADATEVFQALSGLASIAEGDVEVFSDTEGTWVITFIGNLARQNVNLLLEDTNTTDGTIAVVETRAGTTGRWDIEFRDDLAGINITELIAVESTNGSIAVATTTTGATGPWVVNFVGNLAGKDISEFVVAENTNGTIAVATTTAGVANIDTLNSIELADLTGGFSANNIDVSAFGGTALIKGQGGDDVIVGTALSDTLLGGLGNDTISGGGGADVLDGGRGFDFLFETGDSNFILTNTALNTSGVIDTLNSFESAILTGGASANTIDASAFTAVSENVELELLNGWQGVGFVELKADGTPANDIKISSLANGNSVEVDLFGSETIQHVLDRINNTQIAVFTADNGSIQVVNTGDTVDAADGNRYQYVGATPGIARNLMNEIQTITFSDGKPGDTFTLTFGAQTTAAIAFDADTASVQSALEGLSAIGSGNVSVRGNAGAWVVEFEGSLAGLDVSTLAAAATGGSVAIGVNAIEDFSNTGEWTSLGSATSLFATLNAAKTAIVVQELNSSANIVIQSINGSTAAEDLGISGIGAAGTLTGTALGAAGFVTLDGAAGADTLVGTDNKDLLTGGLGNDSIDGGLGNDKIFVVRDDNISFTAAGPNLDINIGTETDSLTSVELADISGGNSANIIDASNFTGTVTLRTGGGTGLDTLTGSSGNDRFFVDVSALTPGQKISIDVNGGLDNEVIIQKPGSNVSNADFNWIDFGTGPVATQTVAAFNLVLTENITAAGQKIRLVGHDITINGFNISTNAPVAGAITIKGQNITIDGNAQITAQSTTTVADAAITIENFENINDLTREILRFDAYAAGASSGGILGVAAGVGATVLQGVGLVGSATLGVLASMSPVSVAISNINIIDADIIGGDITLKVSADNTKIFDGSDFGNFKYGDQLASAFDAVIGSITGALTDLIPPIPVAVAYTHADLNINVGEAVTVVADSFTASAKAVSSAAAAPSGDAEVLGIAVSIINASANVTIAGDITTNVGNLVIESSLENSVSAEAEAGSGAKSVSINAAVSVIISNSTVQVTETANLIAAGNVNVTASTTDENTTSATSTTEASGAVGLALAISIENGNTLAYLDGDVDAAGNINVIANHSNADDHTVQASAGIAKAPLSPKTEDPPTPVKDAGVEILKSAIINPLLEGIGLSALQGPAGGVVDLIAAGPPQKEELAGKRKKPLKFDLGAAFALAVETNNAEARIGDPATTEITDIEADGDIKVSAEVVARPSITATSFADADNTVGKTAGRTGTGKVDFGGTPGKFGGSFAVPVGLYNNFATATVESTTELDAKGDITVSANTENKIDPNSLFGINLVAPFLASNRTADYTSGQGVQTVDIDQTVDVSAGHIAGGDVGTRYKYLGDGVNSFTGDLETVNFGDGNTWEKLGNPSMLVANEFIGNLLSYADQNLGLQNSVNVWTQATASGQKLSVAGAVSVLLLKHDAQALIKSGALINQDAVFQAASSSQDVIVEATSVNHLVNFVGNIQLPGIYPDQDNRLSNEEQAKRQASRDRSLSPNAVFSPPSLGTKPVAGGSAAGIAFSLNMIESNVLARIEDGVTLQADSLEVDAANEELLVSVGGSGGQAGNVGFNGVVLINAINDTSYAIIDNGATLDIGSAAVGDADSTASIFVNATDVSNVVTLAGSLSMSESKGIAASVGVTTLDRDTQAVIGNLFSDTSADAPGTITSAGDIDVSAINDGFIGTFAIAGSKTGPAPPDPNAPPPNPPPPANTGKSGFGFSGSVAVNIVSEDVQAYLNEVGNVTAGRLSIQAQSDTDIASFAGGVSLALNTGAGTNIGIAGAVGVNIMNGDMGAGIDGANTLTVSSIDIDAIRNNTIVSITAGLGGASGVKGIGIGGSVSINTLSSDSRAFFNNTASATVNGSVSVNAADNSQLIIIGGAGGFGGKAGVGVGVAYSSIDNDISSRIDSVASITHTGNLDVTATTGGVIVAVTGSVGVATGATTGFGLTGTLSINLLSMDVDASILNTTSTPGSTGNISVIASDTSSIFSFAGGFAAGKTVGLGAALAINDVSNTIFARVEGSTLRSNGNFTVKAEEKAVLTTISVGGAGSGKFAAGVGVAVNLINNKVGAYVTRNTFNSDETEVDLGTGDTVFVSIGHSAGGVAGESYRYIGSTALQKVDLNAENFANTANWLSLGVDSSDILVDGAVTVEAKDMITVVSIAGGLAGSTGPAAIGASVGVNLIANTTVAEVDNSKVESTTATIDVTASADSSLIAVAIGGAGGKTLAIGGSVSVNEVKNTVEAKVTNGSDLDAVGDINIQSADSTSMIVVSGGLAGAGKVAIGASVGTVQIDNQIRAIVDGASITSSAGSINVTAGFTPSGNDQDLSAAGLGPANLPDEVDPSAQIINITVAGGGAGTFAAGAAISLNWLKNTVEASITDSTVLADINVNVAARDDADLIGVAVGATGAGTAAVGAAVSFNYIGGDPGDPSRTDTPADDTSANSGVVRAFIDNSDVDATTGEINVLAASDAKIINVTVGGAGAGTVAVAGSISINFIKMEVDAAILNGAVVNAGTSVNVGSSARPSMIIVAGAGSGAGTVAVGLAAATNDMRSNVKARIEGSGTTVTALNNDINVTAQVLAPAAQASVALGADMTTVNADKATYSSVEGDVFINTNDTVYVSEGHNDTGAGTEGNRYKFLGTDQALDLRTENFSNTGRWQDLGVDQVGNTDKPIIVDAQIWSFAVAGGGAGTVAVNGSLALNWIRNDIDAHISNGAAATANNGTVRLLAEDKASMSVLAGSGGGAGVVAVGVGVAYNYIGGNPDDPGSSDVNTVQAYVDNATINANALDIEAKSDADINALVVAVSGSGTVAANGSISLNWIRKDIKAHISGGANVTTTQNVNLLAWDISDIRSISGQISGSGTVAVGGAVSYNEIANKISAYIDGSTTTVSSLSGTITITALSESEIFNISAGVAGSGVASVAGSVSVNLIANDIVSSISGSTVTAEDNLYLLADSFDKITAIVGTISGAGAVGVGGAVVVNELSNTTKAFIADDATVVARGNGGAITIKDWIDNAEGTETTESMKGVAVVASAEDRIFVVAAAGGIAGTVGIGANVSVNRVSATTEAYIRDSRVNSSANRGKAVKVKANSNTDIVSTGGSLGVGLAAAGVGAAVDTNFIDNTTSAYISDDADLDKVYAGEDVEVSAFSRENVLTVEIGIGVGLYAGVAGAASAVKTQSTTEAYIKNADVEATGSVIVDADSLVKMQFIDGAVGGGAVGAGGSVAVSIFNDTTRAYIAGSRVTTTNGDINVNADSTEDVFVTVATGSAGVVALAGAVNVVSSDYTTQAWIGADGATNSLINSGNDVVVSANNTTRVNQGGFTATGSVSVGAIGAGASVDVITVKNSVDANIADNTIVNADRSIKVNATTDRDIKSTVIAFAGGAFGGVSGGVSVISIGTGMDQEGNDGASPSQGAIDSAFKSSVDGLNSDPDDPLAGRAQAAGDASTVTTTLSTDSSTSSSRAWIGNNATITAGISDATGDIEVIATDVLDVNIDTGGGAAGATVAVGGAVAILTVSGQTDAFVGSNTTLSAADDITIKARYDANDLSVKAYGGAVGSVGLGAQVAIINDTASQNAYILHSSSDVNGTRIIKADDVNIVAEAERDLSIITVNVTGGLVAAGAAIGRATVGGSTDAFLGHYTQIGQTASTVNDVYITAESNVVLSVDNTAVAAGIGGGAGNDATVDINPLVRAFIDNGGDIKVAGAVSVNAEFIPDIDTNTNGVSAGGLAVGVSITNVTISPVLIAAVGDPDDDTLGNVVIEANSLSIIAETGLPVGGYSAQADSNGSSGALIGVDATISTISNNSKLNAYIAGNSTVIADNAVLINASN